MLSYTRSNVVSDAEVLRVDTQVADLTTKIVTQAAEIDRLKALLPPAPPVPVVGGMLTIEGGKLRRAGATEPVVMRVAEVSYGDADVSFGPTNLCALVKSLGFNGISPLFGQNYGTLAHMKALGDAALAAGLIYLPNGDHQTNGRAWLTKPENVAYWESLPNCIVRLEIEVDLPGGGDNPPDSAYVAGALGLVNAYRAAGGTRVIQVGAYQGGRRLEHVLRAGAQVVAGDPLKRTLLGWQAYWSQTGTWYQGCAGLANGVAGTRAGIAAFNALSNPGCLGLLWRTNEQSLVNALALIDECVSRGQSFMWWELAKDAITDNNLMVDWDLKTLSPTGVAIAAKLKPIQKLYF